MGLNRRQTQSWNSIWRLPLSDRSPLLSVAAIISMHLPSRAETRRMVSDEALEELVIIGAGGWIRNFLMCVLHGSCDSLSLQREVLNPRKIQ
jgi:hypothetical protein